jgi:hypothetical protein
MLSPIPLAAIIAGPLLVVLVCTWLAKEFYSKRLLKKAAARDDVETVLNADVPRGRPDGTREFKTTELPPRRVVAQVAKPRRASIKDKDRAIELGDISEEIDEGRGEKKGFGRMFKFRKGKKSNDDDQDERNNTKYDDHPQRGEFEQPGLHNNNNDTNIPAPQQIYTSATYGRYNSTEPIREILQADDGKALDVWRSIEKIESMVKSKPKSSMTTHDDGVETVELHGESVWKKDESPISTPPKHVVGSDSEIESGESESSSGEESGDDSDSEDEVVEKNEGVKKEEDDDSSDSSDSDNDSDSDDEKDKDKTPAVEEKGKHSTSCIEC